jgi:hypothetical protein
LHCQEDFSPGLASARARSGNDEHACINCSK